MTKNLERELMAMAPAQLHERWPSATDQVIADFLAGKHLQPKPETEDESEFEYGDDLICPECGESIDDEFVDAETREAECPNCGAIFDVPEEYEPECEENCYCPDCDECYKGEEGDACPWCGWPFNGSYGCVEDDYGDESDADSIYDDDGY